MKAHINDTAWFACQGPRPYQEDYVAGSGSIGTGSRLFVLCDGMGGLGHGDLASAAVGQTMHEWLATRQAPNVSAEDMQAALDCAVEELKRRAEGLETDKAPGTTVVAVAINADGTATIGHVGDSRCYLFDSDGAIKLRTRDHSLVHEAVEAEILTEEEAWDNPRKNVLTRCILADGKAVEIEVDTVEPRPGDTMLLCSDGVPDAMRDAALRVASINRPAEKFAEAIKTQCKAASHDNYSAIILTFEGDGTEEKGDDEKAKDNNSGEKGKESSSGEKGKDNNGGNGKDFPTDVPDNTRRIWIVKMAGAIGRALHTAFWQKKQNN